MGNVLVEFRNNLAQPELRPINGVRTSEVMLASADVRPSPEASPARDSKAVARSGDEVLTAALVQDVVRKATDVSVSTNPVNPPEVIKPTQPALPAQLAWGRWGAAIDSTDFALARTLAREGRATTVGDNDFILYRTEQGPATLPQGVGNVSFALDQAHAHFTSAAGQVQAAAVQNGSLSIDFASRVFSTSLSLTSAATGAVGLQATGGIRDDGLFVSRTAGQVIGGAHGAGRQIGRLPVRKGSRRRHAVGHHALVPLMKQWLASWLMRPWHGRALALGVAAVASLAWLVVAPGSLAADGRAGH
jgi:hypothetical protein